MKTKMQTRKVHPLLSEGKWEDTVVEEESEASKEEKMPDVGAVRGGGLLYSLNIIELA